MPCIDNSFKSLQVYIHTNDHRPPHVHVFGGENEAVFVLNCPTGPIELRENYGFKTKDINGMIKYIMGKLLEFCGAWRKIHGAY